MDCDSTSAGISRASSDVASTTTPLGRARCTARSPPSSDACSAVIGVRSAFLDARELAAERRRPSLSGARPARQVHALTRGRDAFEQVVHVSGVIVVCGGSGSRKRSRRSRCGSSNIAEPSATSSISGAISALSADRHRQRGVDPAARVARVGHHRREKCAVADRPRHLPAGQQAQRDGVHVLESAPGADVAQRRSRPATPRSTGGRRARPSRTAPRRAAPAEDRPGRASRSARRAPPARTRPSSVTGRDSAWGASV